MGLTLFHLSQRNPGKARAAANPSVIQSLPGLESLSCISQDMLIITKSHDSGGHVVQKGRFSGLFFFKFVPLLNE